MRNSLGDPSRDVKILFTFVQNHSYESLICFFGAIGPQQVILILVIVLLLFGGRKIPELMRGLGSGIKEFKNATKEEEEKEKKED